MNEYTRKALIRVTCILKTLMKIFFFFAFTKCYLYIGPLNYYSLNRDRQVSVKELII